MVLLLSIKNITSGQDWEPMKYLHFCFGQKKCFAFESIAMHGLYNLVQETQFLGDLTLFKVSAFYSNKYGWLYRYIINKNNNGVRSWSEVEIYVTNVMFIIRVLTVRFTHLVYVPYPNTCTLCAMRTVRTENNKLGNDVAVQNSRTGQSRLSKSLIEV